MAAQYIYTYSGKENIAIEDFLSPSNRLFSEPISVDRFLRFEGDTDMNNADRIYLVYNDVEKAANVDALENFNLPYIKPGTDVVLPTGQIAIEYALLYGRNLFLRQQDFAAYWADTYINLLSDPLYYARDRIISVERDVNVEVINENLRVYIWVASLNRIIDASPFVRRMSTSKNFEVGSFSLTIEDVPTIRNVISTDRRDLDNFIDTGSDIINTFSFNASHNADVLFRQLIDSNERDRNFIEPRLQQTLGFFEAHLQYNDVVFLRYETLALETRRPGSTRETVVPNTFLPNQVWDMIGLIDTVRVSHNEQNTEKTLQVAGRDLMKLLIDDASYFIPAVFNAGGDLQIVYGGNADESYFKRNIISGAYDYFFAYVDKSIRDVMGFIINHLSNLEIVDDSLFDSYGDRISQRYVVTGADQNYIETKEVRGIWKIIKLFIDPVTDNRRIADDSIAKPDGSLLNYVKRICQEPFVEFYGDTNGDTYDFTIRQAPLTGSAYRQVLRDTRYITILEKDVLSYTLEWETRYYSWYQIQAQNAFLGTDNLASLSIIPIIFLPQYVNKFGNKRLILTDNYIFRGTLQGDQNNQSLNTSTFAENILNDLKYIIDINAYLPFSRRGTITLNGDRRIKIGTFVRFRTTEEIFYVVNVSQSVVFSKGSIERVTVLTVERGLKIGFIQGFELLTVAGFPPVGQVDGSQARYSYFDIVDTQLIVDTILRRIQGDSTIRSTSANFAVNEPVFRFFAERRQMQLG